MRTFFVVLLSPTGDFGSCVEQVREPVGPQALLAQPPVEALDMSVLGRLAGLDRAQFDLPLQSPGEEVPAGQFGAVVTADSLRSAAARDDLVQHGMPSSSGDWTAGAVRLPTLS